MVITDRIRMKQGDMQVRIVGESEGQAWDDMVKTHHYGCVFHTFAFRRVLCETFRHITPYYLALVDERGRMRGGMPLFLVQSWLTGRRLVSLPFAFYSDPLVSSVEELSRLFERVLELYQEHRVSYLEIKTRSSADLLGRFPELQPLFHHKTFWIDLTQGLEQVWGNFHKTAVQQRIRRSEREGIVVRSATSEEDVVSFYNMLVHTRKRLGIPPQHYAFFQKMWQYLVPSGTADFLIAEVKGQLIGGATIFLFRDTLYVGYIASRPEYWPMGVDQALFWKAVQLAVQNSCKVYDVGKTSPFAEGLMTYKRRWGARELETPSFYYPHPKGVSSLNDERKLSHRVMTLMWQKLPDPLLKIGGRFAYRHLG